MDRLNIIKLNTIASTLAIMIETSGEIAQEAVPVPDSTDHRLALEIEIVLLSLGCLLKTISFWVLEHRTAELMRLVAMTTRIAVSSNEDAAAKDLNKSVLEVLKMASLIDREKKRGC